MVGGKPGIGKSTLLRSVVEQARRSGYAVGTGKAERRDRLRQAHRFFLGVTAIGPRRLLPAEAFASLAPLHEWPLWPVDLISAVLKESATASPV
jgi:predicted ATP-dependent serine protease